MHLIECVDGKTEALFNKVVRESIIKIRWELKWFEEDGGSDAAAAQGVGDEGEGAPGRWVPSVGRYFIRMANQLLVEDEEVDGEKGFVMITADANVRLHHCGKGRGQEDFNRLILENQVQSTSMASEEAQLPLPAISDISTSGKTPTSQVDKRGGRRDRRSDPEQNTPDSRSGSSEINNELVMGLAKVWDMSKDLKDCVSELLDEKDAEKNTLHSMARAFSDFSMDGDLDAGLRLHLQSEELTVKEENKKHMKGREEREDNVLGEEAWHLAQRVEKGLNKLVRATVPRGDQSAHQAAANAAAMAEIDLVKRREKKTRRDLAEREKELSVLRSAVST